jgi:hypothetical protein
MGGWHVSQLCKRLHIHYNQILFKRTVRIKEKKIGISVACSEGGALLRLRSFCSPLWILLFGHLEFLVHFSPRFRRRAHPPFTLPAAFAPGFLFFFAGVVAGPEEGFAAGEPIKERVCRGCRCRSSRSPPVWLPVSASARESRDRVALPPQSQQGDEQRRRSRSPAHYPEV